MPELLTTLGISHSIEKLIREAEDEIILVTPYIKLSRNLYERLKQASSRGIEVSIVYGKSDLDKKQSDLLAELENLNLFYLDKLHAKCYLNENRLIIGSMNMHEYSERENSELGVEFNKSDDELIINEALLEIKSFVQNAVLKKKSSRTDKVGFVSNVLNIGSTFHRELQKYLNSVFNRELFKIKTQTGWNRDHEYLEGENILSGLNVEIDDRLVFEFKFEPEIVQKLSACTRITDHKFVKNNLRIFYSETSMRITVYKSIKIRDNWLNLPNDEKFKYYKETIEILVSSFRDEIAEKGYKKMDRIIKI
ncbi:MAG: phospholipase D family protein [Bacteroidetes bacterium]|nr:phospholipase D family protein [Bacteroidota bacterium]